MQRTFHDKAVGAHGSEDIVHLRQGFHHAVAFERSRHVKKHDVRLDRFPAYQLFRVIKGVHCIAGNDRIGIPFQLAEMLAGECLEVPALVNQFCFAITESVDAVLWGIAVYHGYIVTFHVVEIVGGKRRNGGFSDTAFLCCECNEDFITHCHRYLSC